MKALALFLTLTLADAAPPAKTAKAAQPSLSAEQRDAQKLHDAALAAFQRGDFAAARAGYEAVLKRVPGNAPALINLALLSQREKKYDDAEKHLRVILRDAPENAIAWLLLGIGAYEQEKLDAAHAHLAQAVLYAPKSAQARQFLGVTLGRKGWYSAGEEELRRAIELDPRSADAHYNLAVLYMERVPAATELARRHYQLALDFGARPDPVFASKLKP